MNDREPARPRPGTSQTSRAGGPLEIAVIGVGLIGGSIGMAMRSRLGARVRGYDQEEQALFRALELGAVDVACPGIAEAVGDADHVFIATPVGTATGIARPILEACGPDCVVSDVGSTKRHIAGAIADPRFVPGHPMAGGETSGVQGARADLFDGALWYLTPAATQPADSLARLTSVIEQIGAVPVILAADAHDRLMASVSHLPHVFANVLVEQALRAAPAAFDSASGTIGVGALGTNPSFRDATRVAGANTAIWTDIYLANSELLAAVLTDAIEELSGIRDALDAEDAFALAQWNDRVRERHERLRAERARLFAALDGARDRSAAAPRDTGAAPAS